MDGLTHPEQPATPSNRDIFIGTSGYSYRDWVGPVYPDSLATSEYLAWYADHLSFVELNFSYYKMPTSHTLERLASATPQGFLFTIKAHRSMTHSREEGLDAIPVFCGALAPLIERNRLPGILLQFPFSFHYTADNRSYLAVLCDRLQETLVRSTTNTTVFLEFRNDEWQRPRTYEYMKLRGLGAVNVDEPDLKGLPTLGRVVTAPRAYLRLHGRNAKNWWTGDNASRYDYRYSEVELRRLLAAVRDLAAHAGVVFVALNNHFRGNAFHNALALLSMSS